MLKRQSHDPMGRTIPFWRMVANSELARLERFSYHLRKEDLEVFSDMMRQCQLYPFYASEMGSTVKEISLLMSIIWGQHKMILDLKRRLDESVHLNSCREVPE